MGGGAGEGLFIFLIIFLLFTLSCYLDFSELFFNASVCVYLIVLNELLVCRNN